MARRNQWEQFADNFTTFYDLSNKVQTGIASKKIMDEEVLVQATGLGPGPQSVYQANYDGKNYNEEITPDMLRGLQYDRIADVRTKFGDATGGMELREKAAGIRNAKAQLKSTNIANELAEKRLVFDVEQARLNTLNTAAQTESVIAGTNVTNSQLEFLEKSMDDRVFAEYLKTKGLEYDNESKQYKLIVEKATVKDKIMISGIAVEAAQLGVAQQKLANEGFRIDNEGNLIELGVDRATQKDKITMSGLEVEGKKQANINAALEGTGLVYTNRGKLVSAEIAEATQGSTVGATNAVNAATQSEAELENNANQTLLDYSKMVKDGKFKDGGGVGWLKENWTGDQATLEVINSLNDFEVDGIMREGALMIKKVEAAMTGKTAAQSIPILQELMDGQDGIPGNLEIKTGEGGAIFLIETDADGNKTSTIKGKNWSDFQSQVLGTLTPLKSIEIAQAKANLAKTEAETQDILNVGLDPNQVARDWNAQRMQIIETAQSTGQPIPSEIDFAQMRTQWINLQVTNAGKGLQQQPVNDDDNYDIKLIDQ